MSAAFTPGPWECFRGHTSYYRGAEDDPEPGVITAPNDGLILAIAVSNAVPQVDANTRLIAAAPDLYEALDEVLPWLEKRPHTAPLKRRAEAALAKARGEA